MTLLLMGVLVSTQWHDPVDDKRAIRMQLKCIVQSSGLSLFLNLSAKAYLVGEGNANDVLYFQSLTLGS